MADGISKRKEELYSKLAELHGIDSLTFEECSKEMGVSARTLMRWSKEPTYQSYLARLRQEWKETAITKIGGLAEEVLIHMRWLMNNAKSHQVQYEATRTLGEWAGLHLETGKEVVDDRDELNRLYDLIENRQQALAPVVNVQLPPGSTITTPRPQQVIEGEVKEQ